MARFYFNCTGGRTYDDDEYANRTHEDQRFYKQGNDPDHTGGNQRSLIMFNSTDIRTRLAGFRITNCALDFYVNDVDGTQATLFFGTHNYTALPASWSASRCNLDRVEFQKYGPGRVTGLNFGVTIGNEFKDGVATGIVFGPAVWDDDDNFAEINIDGSSDEPVLVIDADSLNVAPYAPTLQEPAASVVRDMAAGATTFRWSHSDPNGDPQAAYRFRRRRTDGTYDYWNGSTFVTAVTRMTGNAQQIIVPPGVWPNGTAYEWSVSTEDPSGAIGGYSAGRILYASSPPTCAVTEPITRSGAPRPTIRWTFGDPEGDRQYGWIAQVVTPDVYNAPGYNPENYTSPTWSGSANTLAQAATVGRDLQNHRTYRSYVKVASSPNPSGGLQYSPWSFAGFDVVIPPFPSSIIFPQNGSIVDLRSGFTMQWQNTFYGNIGSQTAFAIRRLATGGAYQWWNGATWQATEVFLPGTNTTYAFRENEVLNGVTYTFSIRIRDDYNETSAYSAGVTVVGSSAAQVTVMQPEGFTVVTRPTVTWSTYDLENDPQQRFQIRIIDSDVYTIGGGFDPGTVTAAWDTGEVTDPLGNTRNMQVDTDLTNSTTYRAYVRVMTGGIYSPWSYSEFNIQLIGPAQPVATVQIVPEAGGVDIHVQGRDSMLSAEAGRCVSGWQAVSNGTITQDQFFSPAGGESSAFLRSSAAGNMVARNVDLMPVAAGVRYAAAITAIAELGVTPVNFFVSIEWLSTDLTVITVDNGNVFADDAAVRSYVTAVAPATAALARMRITFQNVPASNVRHRFYDPVIRPGEGGEWSPGGLLGNTSVSIVEANDFRIIRRGLNVPLPIDSQQVTIRDEEPPMGRDQSYEVVARVVYPNATLASLPLFTPTIVWSSGWLWLSDPLRPGSGHAFGPQSFDAITRPVRQGKFRPIGRADAVITTGVRGLREGAFTIVTHSRADREAFLELVNLSEIVLLRIPPDQGEQEGETLYVRLEGDAPEDRPLPSRTPHRTIKQAWTEQLRVLTHLEYEPDDTGLV